MATTKKSTQEEKTTKKTTTKKTADSKKTSTTKATAKKTPTKSAAKTTTKKTTTKKPAAKTTTKKTTTKKPAAKTTTKKTVDEEKKKASSTKITQGFSVKQKEPVDDLLGALSVTPNEEPVETPKKTSKSTAKKPKDTTKPSSTKKTKQTEVKRPERKQKTFTKEEKVLYKRLEEAFNYVANLTMVIEERLLDKKLITDLTLGEIHVLEVVDKESVMPMTKIANELKITVGSLTTCVNRLVKKEYLFRERDADDHRVMKISTTQKAKKVLKLHDRFHEDILYGILDGVTIRDATKVMTQVARTLENYYNPKEKNYEKPIDKKKTKSL